MYSYLQKGVECSSEVERSLMVQWVIGSILHGVDPLSYFSLQPVLHDWCNKGRGMCYLVCGMVYIKEPLLLIDKSSLCGSSGFPFSLSEWSLTIWRHITIDKMCWVRRYIKHFSLSLPIYRSQNLIIKLTTICYWILIKLKQQNIMCVYNFGNLRFTTNDAKLKCTQFFSGLQYSISILNRNIWVMSTFETGESSSVGVCCPVCIIIYIYYKRSLAANRKKRK